jgi:hypothetical protein
VPSFGDAFSTLRQGWRFGTGLRRFLADPVGREEALERFRGDIARREERFLRALDRLVWEVPESPYRALLDHAGADRGDLRRMVDSEGIEHALERLRDEGVYVSYEEFLGAEPLRRGSLTLQLDPTSFHNPTVTPDYLGSTGGTRSGGTPIAVSFADKRASAHRGHLTRMAHGLPPATPGAVWFPCLPSAAGLGVVLQGACLGAPPERWFSQIPTTMPGVPLSKRITNTMLPTFGRLAGTPLPRPEHTPSSEPGAVLEWCTDTLRERGTATLSTYPSSAVRLARAAEERGESLEGLLVVMLGEPATIERRRAVERSGARTAAGYAFMQAGGVGYTCPDELSERYHIYDGKVAVITRRRPRADDSEVEAFLWTTLSETARGVFINVENDDYGTVDRDDSPCACLYGSLGSRTRVADVRGMSKVVAAGVTVPGEVFERLVDRILPAAIGGSPLDYQFAEVDRDGVGTLVLRVHPSVPEVDERLVLDVVERELRSGEMGRLADEIWRPTASVEVERSAPVAARSGKTLAYEPL